MADRFEEADLDRIRTNSIADRRSKVGLEDIVDPATVFDGTDLTPSRLAQAFPGLLGAESLKEVAGALRRARDDSREIVWLIGAHTIKTGLSRYLGALIKERFITCVASTGSSVIHDLELAFHGKTSEDVAVELPLGRFGMSAETSELFNAACRYAHEAEVGLGAGVGAFIVDRGAPNADVSVFAAAHRAGVPATVHVAFGTDITHQHPGFPAGAVGETTMRDFGSSHTASAGCSTVAWRSSSAPPWCCPRCFSRRYRSTTTWGSPRRV